MSNVKKIIKNSGIFSASLAVVFIIFSGSLIQAQESQSSNVYITPSIYISEVEIDSIPEKGGDVINGVFKVLNQEESIIGNLSWGVELLRLIDPQKTIYDSDNVEIIDYYYDKNILSFSPQSEREIKFSYTLPSNFPQGEYILQILLNTSELAPLAWFDYALGKIGAENEYISFKKLTIITPEGKEFDVLSGIAIDSDKSPKLKVEAFWPGNNSISAFYKIIVFEKSPWGKIVFEQTSTKAIQFNSNSSVDFEVDLPIIDVSGSYVGEIVFLKNNQPISPKNNFRWVISGESGRVLFVKIDKNNYNSGEIANLNIALADRADLADPGMKIVSPLGEIDLKIQIICADNAIIGSKEIKINPLTQPVTDIEVPINSNGSQCGAVVNMIKNNQALHKYQTGPEGIVFNIEQLKPVEEPPVSKSLLIKIIISVVILILAVLILLIWKKKLFRKKYEIQ